MQPRRVVLLDDVARSPSLRPALPRGSAVLPKSRLASIGPQVRHRALRPQLARLRGPMMGGAFARCAALARRAGARRAGRALGAALFGLHAALERIHQIDDVARLGLRQLRDRLAGVLGLDQRDQRILVAILELVRIEVRLLAFENMHGEIEHVGRHFDVGNVGEIVLLVAHLGAVAQRGRHDAIAARRQHQDALAAIEHHAGDADQVFLLHRLADDGEGLGADLVVGRDVVILIEIDFVHLARAARRLRCRWCGCSPAPPRRAPRPRPARTRPSRSGSP